MGTYREELPPLKRGAIKAFREYLNRHCAAGERHYHDAGNGHRYHQRVRQYGDYLYAQDREMFDFELHETVFANAHPDFNIKQWITG